MPSATIKLYLPQGDAKSLRTAEISNWTGKAIAAPRTEIEQLLARAEILEPIPRRDVRFGFRPNSKLIKVGKGDLTVSHSIKKMVPDTFRQIRMS